MPKTANHLWDQIISTDTLIRSYYQSRKGRRYKPDILRFSQNWECELTRLQQELQSGSWHPSPLTKFPVCEPKPRVIEAPAYRDRIVHHALVSVTEPFFEKRFSSSSYACRLGKGAHKAIRAIQHFTRSAQSIYKQPYVLQADIAKYFHSVDHDRLLWKISRVISDRKVINLWSRIIRQREGGKGMPIGALTSQLSANAYLDCLDHYVKSELRVKRYARYMDDFVLILPSKRQAQSALEQVEGFVNSELKLELNAKTRIYPLHLGINFAGYRTFSHHVRPRKSNVKTARKRLKSVAYEIEKQRVSIDAMRQCGASYLGYLRHCHASRASEQLALMMGATMEGVGINENNCTR